MDTDARNHNGFFLRLGLNVGPLILNEKISGGPLEFEADYSGIHSSFDLLIGGTPAPGFVIGGALISAATQNPTIEIGDSSTEGDGTLIFAGIGVFANYYFDPQAGFHLQALLGFAAIDAVNSEGQSSSNDPSGFMFGFGAGYDFWIGDEWSVGPFARIIYSPQSVEEGGVTADYTYIYPSIGAAFTFH
jgi:hypothetical protein